MSALKVIIENESVISLTNQELLNELRRLGYPIDKNTMAAISFLLSCVKGNGLTYFKQALADLERQHAEIQEMAEFIERHKIKDRKVFKSADFKTTKEVTIPMLKEVIEVFETIKLNLEGKK